MQKPNNYETTQAAGEYERPDLGGHYAVIKNVRETKTQTGLDMLEISFDFAQNDRQAGKFLKDFCDDIRPDKKWPAAGTARIFVHESGTTDCSRQFKGFTTAVEHSNQGFNANTNWGPQWGAMFKGKLVGVVFGEEEYLNKDGQKVTASKPRYFIGTESVPEAKIPKLKPLKDGAAPSGSQAAPAYTAPVSGFAPVMNMDDIPF